LKGLSLEERSLALSHCVSLILKLVSSIVRFLIRKDEKFLLLKTAAVKMAPTSMTADSV
uniref:Uncharacterized protein n=1 Tax=Amphimedon queenslandica TaxID=400682 RepID=A0A1X7SI09_AMPQE